MGGAKAFFFEANYKFVGLLLPIVPRNRVVTPDVVTEALGEVDRPFVTTGDVADKLGVTKQAVRNHHEELNQASGLESGKVGRQRVYWLADDSVPEQVTQTESEPRTPEPPEPESEPPEQEPESDSAEGLLDRFFTGDVRPRDVPGVALILLAILIPIYVVRRSSDWFTRRLSLAVEAYAEGEVPARFGSPLNAWLLTLSSAMLGVTVGVALGIVVFEPGLGVASLAVSVVAGLSLLALSPAFVHILITRNYASQNKVSHE